MLTKGAKIMKKLFGLFVLVAGLFALTATVNATHPNVSVSFDHGHNVARVRAFTFQPAFYAQTTTCATYTPYALYALPKVYSAPKADPDCQCQSCGSTCTCGCQAAPQAQACTAPAAYTTFYFAPATGFYSYHNVSAGFRVRNFGHADDNVQVNVFGSGFRRNNVNVNVDAGNFRSASDNVQVNVNTNNFRGVHDGVRVNVFQRNRLFGRDVTRVRVNTR
jgi:hypothetical protein